MAMVDEARREKLRRQLAEAQQAAASYAERSGRTIAMSERSRARCAELLAARASRASTAWAVGVWRTFVRQMSVEDATTQAEAAEAAAADARERLRATELAAQQEAAKQAEAGRLMEEELQAAELRELMQSERAAREAERIHEQLRDTLTSPSRSSVGSSNFATAPYAPAASLPPAAALLPPASALLPPAQASHRQPRSYRDGGGDSGGAWQAPAGPDE